MIMEDLEAPHHLLLLRYFMAQGLAHGQPIFFASPLPSPKAFLGTLPGPGKDAAGGGAHEAAQTATSQVESLVLSTAKFTLFIFSQVVRLFGGDSSVGIIQSLIHCSWAHELQEDNLRIAWQYKRYLQEQKALDDRRQRQASSGLSWSKLLQNTAQAAGNDWTRRRFAQ